MRPFALLLSLTLLGCGRTIAAPEPCTIETATHADTVVVDAHTTAIWYDCEAS